MTDLRTIFTSLVQAQEIQKQMNFLVPCSLWQDSKNILTRQVQVQQIQMQWFTITENIADWAITPQLHQLPLPLLKGNRYTRTGSNPV